MSMCAHRSRLRCWPCQTDGCYDTPRLHAWWNNVDVAHAAATGQPAPSGWCGCAFCGEPAARREPAPVKASRLVLDESRVVLTFGGGGERGRGRVVGYYDHPSYLVELDSGERVTWSERLTFEVDGTAQ